MSMLNFKFDVEDVADFVMYVFLPVVIGLNVALGVSSVMSGSAAWAAIEFGCAAAVLSVLIAIQSRRG